jgi:predicted nucleic acid-binding protein
VDTSVLASYYVTEPRSRSAEGAILTLDDPVISSLTSAELCSALARRRHERSLGRRDIEAVIGRHREHVRSGALRQLVLAERHWRRSEAILLGASPPLRTLDALHVAAALEEDLLLLTADRRLAAAMRAAAGRAQLLAASPAEG